jgi:ferrous iron transport protein B
MSELYELKQNEEEVKKLVLVGNPNVGKSVFFNALTGSYVDVSNFPGTTVDISRGRYKNYVIEDTPGVYGVSSFNDEETVARDIILGADIILNVVDAVHIYRDLFLTQQLLDMGKKLVVAVNMMDEVEKNGIVIDIDTMSKLLGVPVIGTAALKKQGIEQVEQQLENARQGNRVDGIIELLSNYVKKGIPEHEALLILEDDINVVKRNKEKEVGMQEEIYKNRRKHIDEIIKKVLTETNKSAGLSVIIGRLMLKPLTGIPVLLLTLIAMFGFIGVFVAQTIVEITEESIMTNIYKPAVVSLFEKLISQKTFLGQILIGEFGLFTMVPIYVIGLLLPLVVGFYFMLSILEDSGYLPRIAALSDRMMTSVGLNGRAVIPIILGFGCITAATMTTRLLGSRRERIIATALLGITIPCSAQLGVIVGLLAPLGIFYSIVYIVMLFLVFGIIGAVLNRILPERSTDLLIDIPPLRIPSIYNVLKKTYLKSKAFLLEAAPLFAFGALLISILKYTKMLSVIENLVEPLIVNWLKLPREAATVFIMGIIRRDFGAAGLTSMSINANQMLTALITVTLFVPCVASILVIFKERTKREAVMIWFGSFFTAFLIGGILARVLVLI